MKSFGRYITLSALAFLASLGFAQAGTITDLNQLPGSAFGQYSLVAGGGSNSLQLTSDTTITGNVAVGLASTGPSSVTLQGGGAPITGNLNFAGTSNGTGSVTVSGATTTNSATAAQAVDDATSLYLFYSALTSLPTISGNTLNVTTNPGASYNGNTNEHVYEEPTSFNGALAITAAANQYVIIDVGQGSSSNYSLGAVSLSGGITSDHVLFNIDTTGNLSSSNAHGDVVNAIVIDDAGLVNVDNFTLDGRLFCEVTQANCQVVSNAKINSSVDIGTATPEPASVVLVLGGLVLVGGLTMRQAKRA